MDLPLPSDRWDIERLTHQRTDAIGALGFVPATLHKPWRERPRRAGARNPARNVGVAHARVCLCTFVSLTERADSAASWHR
jgi:hypothetical protein